MKTRKLHNRRIHKRRKQTGSGRREQLRKPSRPYSECKEPNGNDWGEDTENYNNCKLKEGREYQRVLSEWSEKVIKNNNEISAILIAEVANDKKVDSPHDEYIKSKFNKIFPEGTDPMDRFITFLGCLVQRKIYKKNKNVKKHKPTKCYETIKQLIINFNKNIPPEENLGLEDQNTSIFTFEFINTCVEQIMFILLEGSITKKNITDTIESVIEYHINEQTNISYIPGHKFLLIERFYNKDSVNQNKYLLFQIILQLINILFLSANRTCFDKPISRFHITLDKIIKCMDGDKVDDDEEDEADISPEIGVGVAYDLGNAPKETEYDVAPQKEGVVYSIASDSDEEHVHVNWDEEGGRRTKRMQKKKRKTKKNKRKNKKSKK